MGKKILLGKLLESAKVILPISIIVLIVGLSIGIEPHFILNFIFGALLLIIGLSFFSIGSLFSMVAIAESIGEYIIRRRNLTIFILVAFLVGFMITIAEPALWVLADQFKSVVKEPILILSVSIGVGIFVIVALLRILTQFRLNTLFMIAYAILFMIAIALSIVNPSFIPIAFDSGGVTTGPMAVPFIMALGFGIARTRGDKFSDEDSFGLIGVASIGPIIAVLFLGFFYEPVSPVNDFQTNFLGYFIQNLIQMAIAILPFLLFFIIFQLIAFKMNKKRVIKIFIAFLYTYVGLVLFLTGANAGLVNMGYRIGVYFASLEVNWIMVPLGMIFGFTIVAAEPSVIALNRQVETVSAGAISKKFMMASLSIGVSIAIGLACIRVLTGLSIWWILLPGYTLAISLTFITPKIFSSIAFDSGGAVSGAMTSAFLVPFAIGAANALGSNVLMDAFGLVAFVALAPLITIQILGLIYRIRMKRTFKQEDESDIINLKEVKS